MDTDDMRLIWAHVSHAYRTIVRARPQPGVRRQSECLLERTSEVALIGEFARGRDICDRAAVEHHAARFIQPPCDQIAIGTGAEHGAEVARQLPAVMARRALQ